MTMNFFEHQERARRNTRTLVCYLALALAALIAALYFLSMAYLREYTPNRGWFNGHVLLWVSGVTLGVVFLGSLSKTLSLRSGGQSLARMLGGEALDCPIPPFLPGQEIRGSKGTAVEAI
jgi:hypothetical protein